MITAPVNGTTLIWKCAPIYAQTVKNALRIWNGGQTRKTTSSPLAKFAVHTRKLTTDPVPPLPPVLARSDGATLLYESRINWIHGSPAAGKSWVSIFTIMQAIRRGSRVALWDFEGHPDGTAGRLQALGALDVLESPDLVYVRPSLQEDAKAMSALGTVAQRGSEGRNDRHRFRLCIRST